MSVMNQIQDSNLSKKGMTNPSGIFEGVPENVVNVQRGYTIPQESPTVSPIVLPVDVTFNMLPQPTYLNYLRSSNRR